MAHGAIEWLEIPATDLTKAPQFYETVFGWKINRMPGMDQYPMFMDAANQLGGGFTASAKPMAEAGVLLYITVDEIDTMVPRITAAGGKMAKPKTAISPEIGWWANFHDPSGNLIGLYQKAAAR